MLFWDELIRRDSSNNDKNTVSGDLKSRTLAWWPTNVNQNLKVLCKVLTESICKLDGLRFSLNKVTDEGVKHIVEALSNTNGRLNSLNLSHNDVRDEGVNRIAEALSNTNCRLNTKA